MIDVDPHVVVYIIVVVPPVRPDTRPVEEPIVATTVLLLLQVPPVVTSLKVVLPNIPQLALPLIAAGKLTVTLVVALLPHPFEYVMAAVP